MTIIPSKVAGQNISGRSAPSDTFQLAAVGVGGQGSGNLRNLVGTGIVPPPANPAPAQGGGGAGAGAAARPATPVQIDGINLAVICDIDDEYSKGTRDRYPNAKYVKDWRRMLDDSRDIDGVMVATADHTHAIITANAISLGKHVYTEKPLTHSVYESRLLAKLADYYGVASQMGNQGASGAGVAQSIDWILAGEIGEVRLVEGYTSRPMWPQGLDTPTTADPVPAGLDWDAFIGPAKFRPYNKAYHPWDWRGWWDFGTGALGDMACHNLHTVFKALKLGHPTSCQGSSVGMKPESCPHGQFVTYEFPDRGRIGNINLPPLTVHWYDGGMMPPRPANLADGRSLSGEGAIIYGSKDTLIHGTYGNNPYLVSGRTPEVPQVARRVETNHYQDWIRAAKEPKATRVKSNSDFSEAGPFTEFIAMAVLAVRLAPLNRILQWDGDNMRFTNIGADETIRRVTGTEIVVVDGDPTVRNVTENINALEWANELIKHTYRTGWNIPDMPR
jgi:predicted dehydrogenase